MSLKYEKELLLDKYKPKSFSESVLNRDVIITLQNFINDNILYNLVLYGPNGCGKYTMAMLLLNELYNEGVYKKKKIHMELGNAKTVELISSIYHFEIYANHYAFNDKTSLVHLLERLVTNKNISIDSYNVVIIRNCQYLKKELFFTIKKFSEKYIENCRFILLTNNINVFRNSITNFMFIRVPKETTANISNYICDIIRNEGKEGNESNSNISASNESTINESTINESTINESTINKLVDKLDNNLSDIMIHIEYKLLNGTKYIDYFKSKINLIIKLLETKKISNLIKIRELLYELTCKNIEKKRIIINIVQFFIKSKKYDNLTKRKIIRYGAHFEEKLNKAYKDFVHLEGFIIAIMNILVQ